MDIPVPEGQVAQRPLQFFWLADYSWSMDGRKIATLNQAILEALPEVRKAVSIHPEVKVEMRAIKFADQAEWHVGPNPVPVEQFAWPELKTAGLTATAQAIRLLASQLTTEKMPSRGYPPVCILISDGCCTEAEQEYNDAIAQLDQLSWGKRAVRLAIAIGDESDYDEAELLKFVNQKEIGVLKAHSPEQLVQHIRWASVTASVGATQGKNNSTSGPNTPNVVLGAAPVVADDSDVF